MPKLLVTPYHIERCIYITKNIHLVATHFLWHHKKGKILIIYEVEIHPQCKNCGIFVKKTNTQVYRNTDTCENTVKAQIYYSQQKQQTYPMAVELFVDCLFFKRLTVLKYL